MDAFLGHNFLYVVEDSALNSLFPAKPGAPCTAQAKLSLLPSARFLRALFLQTGFERKSSCRAMSSGSSVVAVERSSMVAAELTGPNKSSKSSRKQLT